MKRILSAALLAALCLGSPGPAIAAGTVTETSIERLAGTSGYVLTLTCTADSAAATYPSTATSAGVNELIDGLYLYQVETDPGATAPTDNYDIEIRSARAVDLMGTGLANRDTANTEIAYPGSMTPLVDGALTIVISGNSVNSAVVVMRLYFSRSPGGRAGTGSGGADTALSNLAAVAINLDLEPASDGSANLGSASKNFGTAYIRRVVPKQVTLTPGASVTPDASAGSIFLLTLDQNTTVANPTNAVVGQTATFWFQQAAAGGPFTITLGSNFKYGVSGAPTEVVLGTTASKWDRMIAEYKATNTWEVVSFAQGFETASAAQLPGISTLNTLTGATQTLGVDTTTGATFGWSSSGTAHTLQTGTDFSTRTVGITVDGAGSAITTGVKGFIEVPFNATIIQATTLLDQSGSIVFDVWKDTYANYAPTVADTITASAKPTVSTATKAQDATLTGWTTAITAGDIIGFNVDSITTATRAHLILKLRVN